MARHSAASSLQNNAGSEVGAVAQSGIASGNSLNDSWSQSEQSQLKSIIENLQGQGLINGKLSAEELAQLVMMLANQNNQQKNGGQKANAAGGQGFPGVQPGGGQSPTGGPQMRGSLPKQNFQNKAAQSPKSWSPQNSTAAKRQSTADQQAAKSKNEAQAASLPQTKATEALKRKIPNYDQLAPKLQQAALDAVKMGLRVTSTTGGKHAATSNHYRHNQADNKGHAIDVAGSHAKMAAFYKKYAGSNPKELYYDPLGGIKRGRQIGAIGGHGNHVHLALS